MTITFIARSVDSSSQIDQWQGSAMRNAWPGIQLRAQITAWNQLSPEVRVRGCPLKFNRNAKEDILLIIVQIIILLIYSNRYLHWLIPYRSSVNKSYSWLRKYVTNLSRVIEENVNAALHSNKWRKSSTYLRILANVQLMLCECKIYL